MLSESFVASTLASGRTPAAASLKDVGICIHELQPSPALRSAFKKSSTTTNCLAVSASHIFAAQAEKAVIHVYSRERGNQEAVVPFPERIHSIALAGGQNGDILILGTEGGRLIVWEVTTGRQVSTTTAHLQPVTRLVVDRTSNFILSGSSDASVHIWSLFDILTFTRPSSAAGEQRQPYSPVHTFSDHRAAITSLAVGHSAGQYNIAISTSKDNTAIAWDYRTGKVLRTFLLPFSATCVALDPVDRAAYVGYEDGSVQSINFYRGQSAQHPLHDPSLQSTPTQIDAEDRWLPPSSDVGGVESIALSYDGTVLLSGHQNGKVLSWNVGRRKYASTVTDYTHPVTNLVVLPPSGLGIQRLEPKRLTHSIVKPRYDHALTEPADASSVVPAEYSLSTHIVSCDSTTTTTTSDEFTQALTHAFFPTSMIEQGLAELASFKAQSGTSSSSTQQAKHRMQGEDEIVQSKQSQIDTLSTELATLKKMLAVNETARRATTDETVQLRTDLVHLRDYIDELHQKQEQARRDRIQRKARKEEREMKRREAWFEAEKKGRNTGDRVLKAMEAEEKSVLTSESEDVSSGDD